jgi:hypothetical protein
MNTIRRWIIRIDAVLVMVAAVAGLTVASLGYYRDTGPYAFLHRVEVGHAGLLQAGAASRPTPTRPEDRLPRVPVPTDPTQTPGPSSQVGVVTTSAPPAPTPPGASS